MSASEQTSTSQPCPKCRTLEPDNCHSMYCPMRPSNELSKTESGWRIGGTNESDSVQSPGFSTAIFDENEVFVARSFGYTYNEAIERAKVICQPDELSKAQARIAELEALMDRSRTYMIGVAQCGIMPQDNLFNEIEASLNIKP